MWFTNTTTSTGCTSTSSPPTSTGRKIDNRHDWKRNWDICRELEQKHGLIPVVKGQELDGGPEARIVDYPRGNVKQQVSSAVRYALQNYRFASPGEFNTLLNLFNVNMEQVEGTVRDQPYKGVVYQAMREREKAGKPFKSSLIGKDVGFDALQKKYAEGKEFLKKNAPETEKLKEVIAGAMREADGPHELARLLGEHKINVVMRRTGEGRIYGVTFIDHRHRIAVNGSRLGKAFSAARLEELYGNIGDLERKVASVVSDTSPAPGTVPEVPGPTVEGAAIASAQEEGQAVIPDTRPELYDPEPETAADMSPDSFVERVWPDEYTVWEEDGHGYGIYSPEPESYSGYSNEKYIPEMSDPFTSLLETAAEPNPYEDEEIRRRRKKKQHRRSGLK